MSIKSIQTFVSKCFFFSCHENLVHSRLSSKMEPVRYFQACSTIELAWRFTEFWKIDLKMWINILWLPYIILYEKYEVNLFLIDNDIECNLFYWKCLFFNYWFFVDLKVLNLILKKRKENRKVFWLIIRIMGNLIISHPYSQGITTLFQTSEL